MREPSNSRRTDAFRLVALLASALAVRADAGTPPLDPESLTDARQGLEHLYHAREARAEEAFERIRARHPDSPAPDFLIGAIEWHRVTTGPQGMTAGGDAEKAFFARMDAAIERGEAAVQRDETDVAARFFLGGAYGYKARYLALQERWWNAYRTGKKGVGHLEKVVELDPDFGDAYLGLGIYHYYADVLPKVLKLFGVFVGLNGDRERGLEEIRRARREGLLVEEECRFFLAEIESTFEEDQWAALTWSKSLRTEYPENELFTWLHARILDELHLTDLSTEEWMLLRSRAKGRRLTGFVEYRLARTLLFGGDFEGAAAKLRELLEYGRLGSARITMWGRLRYGVALDFLGRHEEALKQYRIARDLDASAFAKERASARIAAGRRDASVVSLPELAETVRILLETDRRAEDELLRVEALLFEPSRGFSRDRRNEFYDIVRDLAEARLRDGRPEDCLAAADRALDGRPRPFKRARARLRGLRARALHRLDRPEEALAELDRALEEADDDDRANLARDRDLILALNDAEEPGAPSRAESATEIVARDRGELALDVRLRSGELYSMTLRDGRWAVTVPGAPTDTLVYRFQRDRTENRLDPHVPGVEIVDDEAWSVWPHPKQTNSSSSR